MNVDQRQALTKALSAQVAAIAADLRAQMLAEGAVRDRAKRLHGEEQVGEAFEVWTDLLSRRAAVLWVLKTVYVRVLEDRGLLRPGRLLDPEAQQLFEQLAPNLGETAFLSWVFRDLASSRGGLPELFAPQPAEVAVPADALSLALIDFWRAKDADTGFQWSFATEAFAGELMGDLYQELDPVVKDRYALCQTPDFVRDFILGQTLMPAIAERGADQVRLLDPACGSGHFLLDAFRRLVDATATQHTDWPRREVVDHALARVVGIDLNDYACGLARVRMVMTAAELAGVTSLADAAAFHPHVYWADGLEQIERDDDEHLVQLDLFDPTKAPPPRAVLTRPHVRALLKPILRQRFNVVVGNPPYIAEPDELRKSYHRKKIDGKRRYVSAHGDYSLASPFVERCLQTSERNGWIGLIVGDTFMKRDFGKPLIEKVLAFADLSLVVDAANVSIPHHGTPTVLLFIRAREPQSDSVRVVVGAKSDASRDRRAWNAIVEAACAGSIGESEFAFSLTVLRSELAKYPWKFDRCDSDELLDQLTAMGRPLSEVVEEVGRAVVCGVDEAFLLRESAARRLGLDGVCKRVVTGDVVRDWAITSSEVAVYPYETMGGEPIALKSGPVVSHFWRYRNLLRTRTVFGKTPEERNEPWFGYLEHYRRRLRAPVTIAHAFVSSGNHYALLETGSVAKHSAPLIVPFEGASRLDLYALTAYLNSSVVCYLMKRTGRSQSHAGQKHHPDPERATYQFSASKIEGIRIPDFGAWNMKLADFGRVASEAMNERNLALSTSRWTSSIASPQVLRECLSQRWCDADKWRQRAIFAQEEIDWIVYSVCHLVESAAVSPAGPGVIPRGQRAFERVGGRRSFVRKDGRALSPSEAEVETGDSRLALEYEAVAIERENLIRSNSAIAALETYLYKRHWRDTEFNTRESDFRTEYDLHQMREWILERLELACRALVSPVTIAKLVAAIQGDKSLLVVIEAFTGSPSFDLHTVATELLSEEAVPNHPFHVFTDTGIAKRLVWEQSWELQRREDASQPQNEGLFVPVEYSQGSRGKSRDFVRDEYWRLRGKLDVPQERFVVYTETPGRAAGETLFGWAGANPSARIKALLAIDEECEDQGIQLADRIALLDSAWRLIPDVIRDDAATGSRLKAELQAILGSAGPSKVLLDDWKKRFPPPGKGRGQSKKPKKTKAEEPEDEDDE